jgi:hypothetical protein
MDQRQFDALHASCVTAFRKYATEADITAAMLADCTPEPMPFAARLNIALQERIENSAHSLYIAEKVFLHDAARLGYAFTG